MLTIDGVRRGSVYRSNTWRPCSSPPGGAGLPDAPAGAEDWPTAGPSAARNSQSVRPARKKRRAENARVRMDIVEEAQVPSDIAPHRTSTSRNEDVTIASVRTEGRCASPAAS